MDRIFIIVLVDCSKLSGEGFLRNGPAEPEGPTVMPSRRGGIAVIPEFGNKRRWCAHALFKIPGLRPDCPLPEWREL